MADRVGFEPTVPVKVHLISSQGRYNHFDISPNIRRLLDLDIISQTTPENQQVNQKKFNFIFARSKTKAFLGIMEIYQAKNVQSAQKHFNEIMQNRCVFAFIS